MMFEFCNWELKLLLPGRPRALQHVEALVQPVRSGAEHGRSPQALGAIEDSISQGTFLQMTYTAENPHADGSAAPGARPRLADGWIQEMSGWGQRFWVAD